MTEAVVRRCSSKYVFLKMAFSLQIYQKEIPIRFYPMTFATTLRKLLLKHFFHGTPPVAASGMILKTLIWWNFIFLLILISFQLKLHVILINLVKAWSYNTKQD